MAVATLADDFDPSFEQIRRLELEPVEGTPGALRTCLVETLPAHWFEVMPASEANWGRRWFWIGREDALDGDRAAHVLVHEIGLRLRVTNVVGAGDGPDLDIGAQNQVTGLFRQEVAEKLARDGVAVVHETGPVGELRDWIDDDAIDVLARFAIGANRTAGSSHPANAERWNDFLVAALPVSDGTGFADALRAVLVANGWPDASADRLAVQAEQANELLSAYRAAQRMGSAEDERVALDPLRSLLFPDIGSLLDPVRDAKRDLDRRAMLHAADRLLEAAACQLDILVPEQVDLEPKRDLPAVERHGAKGWLRHREEARRLDDVLVDVGPSACGEFPTGAAATRPADDARAARRSRLLGGRRTWRTVVPSHETTRRAVVRPNRRHLPAHADEAELADGPIIETVSAERGAREELGTRRRTGFPNSTTRDDREGACGQRVRAPLDADVESRELEYAAHVGHAAAPLLEAARP